MSLANVYCSTPLSHLWREWKAQNPPILKLCPPRGTVCFDAHAETKNKRNSPSVSPKVHSLSFDERGFPFPIISVLRNRVVHARNALLPPRQLGPIAPFPRTTRHVHGRSVRRPRHGPWTRSGTLAALLLKADARTVTTAVSEARFFTKRPCQRFGTIDKPDVVVDLRRARAEPSGSNVQQSLRLDHLLRDALACP